MKRKILIPKELDINEVEDLIKQEFPIINKYNKQLSEKYTYRICLVLDKIRRGIITNENKFLSGNKNIYEENISFVQISQTIREYLFDPDSKKYGTRIWDEIVIDNLIRPRKFCIEETGELVDYYKQGKACKAYTFVNDPIEFKEVQLPVKYLYLANRLEELEIENIHLTTDENKTRLQVIKNTQEITLESNQSSRAILGAYLKPIGQKSKKYISDFNNNTQTGNSDNFGFRLHHKLTTMKGSLLAHCRVSGEPITGIDIGNSQPYLASVIDSNLINQLVIDIPRLKYLKSIIPILEKYQHEPDFITYRNECTKGNYYEFLMRKYKELTGRKITRKAVKKVNFMVFFSNYKHHPGVKKEDKKIAINLFKSSFPSVYYCFHEIQKLDLGTNRKRYKNICLVLQQVESAIIFNYVVPQLIKKNIWVSTIHDCVIVKEKHKEEVLTIFINQFQSLNLPVPKLDWK